jgi:hypothetical protein
MFSMGVKKFLLWAYSNRRLIAKLRQAELTVFFFFAALLVVQLRGRWVFVDG